MENGQKITVIIPLHDEVMVGTFLNILGQAKISKNEFMKKT